MVARVMFEMCRKYPQDERYDDWCSADLDDCKHSDRAYPLLIVNNFPSGIKVGTPVLTESKTSN